MLRSSPETRRSSGIEHVGDKAARYLGDRLLDFEIFTRADAEQSLTRAVGRAAPAGAVEQALLELRLFGFAVEQEGRFTWAIPLLRETLRASDPERAAERLVEELGDVAGPDGEA